MSYLFVYGTLRNGFVNKFAAMLSRTLQNIARPFNTPWQLVKLERVQSDSVATYLTFKPTALGRTDLTLAIGLKTSVAVDIVLRP